MSLFHCWQIWSCLAERTWRSLGLVVPEHRDGSKRVKCVLSVMQPYVSLWRVCECSWRDTIHQNIWFRQIKPLWLHQHPLSPLANQIPVWEVLRPVGFSSGHSQTVCSHCRAGTSRGCGICTWSGLSRPACLGRCLRKWQNAWFLSRILRWRGADFAYCGKQMRCTCLCVRF